MKHLILIGGPMGIGKTTACKALAAMLPNNVFLDGDWCWNMRPFTVNEETKQMVMDNITFLLSSFLHCSAYENVIFCWVMHEQEIVDEILRRLPLESVCVHPISLVGSERALAARISYDIAQGLRTPDAIGRSLSYLSKYETLSTVKLDVSDLTPEQTAKRLAQIVSDSDYDFHHDDCNRKEHSNHFK